MAEEELNEMGGMLMPSGDSNAGAMDSSGADDAPIDPMDTVEQENAVHSDEETVRDFIDMIDFYKTSKIASFQDISASISEFIQAYEAINQGCGCSKKNRIAHAEQKYLNLVNLNDEEQNSLKGKLNSEKIRLFHQAGLFAEF